MLEPLTVAVLKGEKDLYIEVQLLISYYQLKILPKK